MNRERQELKRRDFLKIAGAGALGMGVSGGASFGASAGGAKAKAPNIVYVFGDQHRQCSWPLGGDPQVKTPNLEILASQGVVFDHCISNHPLCSPYRASLLTGRYQQANTVAGNVGGGKGGLPTTEVTIADVLKQAGYATGYVGKWHLYPGAAEGKPVPPGPHRHGFDWWRVCFNYRKRYETKYYDDDGAVVAPGSYAPTWQMDLALEFIEKNQQGPFFIAVSWHPPHPPYEEAPKRFVEMYSPEKIQLRPNVPKDDPKVRRNYALYFSHISALDEEIGRLMKKLDELGLADNTIVCYSADHGDMLGSFGLSAKNKPWEEAANVPFVIRWPAAIPAGKRLDTLFATVDIAPTLLGLAGQPVLPQMQGADLSAILRGENAPGPESVFIMGGGSAGGVDESEGGDEGEGGAAKGRKAKAGQNKAAGQKKRGKGLGGWRGVRTKRYTYAKQGGKGGLEPWLLYDNESDP
ncbi:MAG: sulfatase-like hydrolase/transferase, partial [Candidatus Sumerlaeota bacterium]|nr:sulfatase-like hydrolase/transferase [Candidatus Sumerlaeota bacterium]